MRKALQRVIYLSKIGLLAMRYRFGSKEESFWEWCLLDLLRTRERTGRCDEHQLYFLAADAMAAGAPASLEKLMYHFHRELGRDFSLAFQMRLMKALGVSPLASSEEEGGSLL